MAIVRKTVINVLNNEYEVKYPNTGEALDIALLKLQISEKYDLMKFSFNPEFQKEVLKIDAMATFSILVPQLKKDLNVKSFYELEEEQMDQVIVCYVEQFLTWYEPIQAEIRNPKKEEPVKGQPA